LPLPAFNGFWRKKIFRIVKWKRRISFVFQMQAIHPRLLWLKRKRGEKEDKCQTKRYRFHSC